MSTHFKINCLIMAKKNMKNSITILLGDKDEIFANQSACSPRELIHAKCTQQLNNTLNQIRPGDSIQASGNIDHGRLLIKNIIKL